MTELFVPCQYPKIPIKSTDIDAENLTHLNLHASSVWESCHLGLIFK